MADTADDGTYELRISTTDDLTIRDVPRAGWTSRSDPRRGDARVAPIELQVVVFEAGIVGLFGRTADGRPWPDRWAVSPETLDIIRATRPRWTCRRRLS